MDLIGKRFGKLLVVANAERKGYVVCECDCKNVKEIRATSLTMKHHPTRSCGCEQRKKAGEIGKKTVAENSKKRIDTDMKFNTNFGVIESETPPKNNRTGHKGISYSSEKRKYHAYINLHRKRIFLGYYDSLEKAITVRKEAEKKYFSPLIEAKEKEKEMIEGC